MLFVCANKTNDNQCTRTVWKVASHVIALIMLTLAGYFPDSLRILVRDLYNNLHIYVIYIFNRDGQTLLTITCYFINIKLVLKLTCKYKHRNEVNEYINVCAQSPLKTVSITKPITEISGEFTYKLSLILSQWDKFCGIHFLWPQMTPVDISVQVSDSENFTLFYFNFHHKNIVTTLSFLEIFEIWRKERIRGKWL